MALVIALVWYMKILKWLQGFLPKIANIIRFIFLVIPIRVLIQKKTKGFRILIDRTCTFKIELMENHYTFSMFSTPPLIGTLRELYCKFSQPHQKHNNTICP